MEVKEECKLEEKYEDFSHLNVLVAEDNLVNQMVIKGLLNKLRVVPNVVENGIEAVEACRNSTYDLVLMDCEMPELDGWEATRQIRSFGYRRMSGALISIIGLSAHVMNIEREKAQAAGMDDYLSKPVSLADLKEAFHRLGL